MPNNLANVKLSELPERLASATLDELYEFKLHSQHSPEFRELVEFELRYRRLSTPVVPDEGWMSN